MPHSPRALRGRRIVLACGHVRRPRRRISKERGECVAHLRSRGERKSNFDLISIAISWTLEVELKIFRFRRHVQGDRVHFCHNRGRGFICFTQSRSLESLWGPVGPGSGPKIHLCWVPKVTPGPSRNPRGTPPSSRTPQPRKSATVVKKSPISGSLCVHLPIPSPLPPIP